MQKPLQLSEDMQKELVDDLAKLSSNGKDTHDAVGAVFGPPSLRRRLAGQSDSGGAEAVPQDDTQVVEETVEQILTQRGTTHGDFTDNARISQMLKDSLRNQHGWGNLNDVQREALDMISHKIARALAGNPDFKDHWDDIAGYAKLVSQRV